MSKIAELSEALEDKKSYVQEIAARAKAEDRGLTDREQKNVKHRLEEIEQMSADIARLEHDAELRKTLESLSPLTESNDPMDPLGRRSPARTIDRQPEPFVVGSTADGKSIGTEFADHVRNAVVKNFGGNISESRDAYSVKSGFTPLVVQTKALITGLDATSGGALVTAQDLGVRDAGDLFKRKLRVRNLLGSAKTTSDQVEYVRVTGFTNSASPTPEATAASGSTGLKPESALTFERDNADVRTIAHWVPITRRALSDGGTVLRNIVDDFLRYGLEEKIEDQIFSGAGTSEDFNGLATMADANAVPDVAWATDLFTTLRKAKTSVETVGMAEPTAYVLHPSDIERLDLETDGEERFYFNGPEGSEVRRVWGLPIVSSTAIDAGTGWCADWRWAVLVDREQASITVGTIDDQLIRNLLTILAEVRLGLMVVRPEAFARIDLSA